MKLDTFAPSLLTQAGLEARHRRYAEYLLLRMADLTQGQKTVTATLILRGEGDAMRKLRVDNDPGVTRCLKTEQPSTSALVECIAGYDQVYANIVRCQHMPDQLPF